MAGYPSDTMRDLIPASTPAVGVRLLGAGMSEEPGYAATAEGQDGNALLSDLRRFVLNDQ